MKTVILDGYALNPGDLSWERFEKLCETVIYDRTPAELTAERIGDADFIITNKTVIGEDIFDACPNIKYVGVLATGYNVIDTEAAHKRGIVVTNIPAYSTDSVAQHVFALLLHIACGIGVHNDAVHEGEWTSCADFTFRKTPLIELVGKTLGVVGNGLIGKRVGEIGKALGMKLLTYSPSQNKPEDLEYLLANSDVVTLHCPLKADNAGLINADNIAKMKDGVIIINTARGGLINEADLAAALESGKVYAFGADVLSTEPPKPDNPLLRAKNTVITPHIAWAPYEARVRLMNIAAGNIEAFVSGNPINAV